MKKIILIPVFIILTYLMVLFLLFSFALISSKFLFSSIAATVIALFDYISSIALYQNSIKKNNKLFLRYNLGGLVVRLILVLSAIFCCLNFLNIEVSAFIFQLFIFYFLLKIFEIKLFAEYKQR